MTKEEIMQLSTDYLNDCESEHEMNELFYYALELLKHEQEQSVTPQPKTGWIPVSERLPEESLNSVIGWDTYRERCVFVQYIDGHFQITGSNESFNIVAWMPLPLSYEAESEGK